MLQPVIVWFRNDLRIHDHPALDLARSAGRPILPVFILEDRWQSVGAAGVTRVGPFRAQVLAQSLADLSERLAQIGLSLTIRKGEAVACLLQLVRESGAAALFCHSEPAWEEQEQEAALAAQLGAMDVRFEAPDGGALYAVEDMPFTPGHVPELFANFRKKVEPTSMVRSPIPRPDFLTAAAPTDSLPLPQAADLCADYDARTHQPELAGGEGVALQWLDDYIWQRQAPLTYKTTRNGLLGTGFSSRLSQWLALGCLSPRWVYAEIRRFEQAHQATESTYWLIFELLWRDYFRLMARKHGASLFLSAGLANVPIVWESEPARLHAWCTGKTGYPLVDAAMRQLRTTGWMSNRARQVVGSFFTKNLLLDWRVAAAWFEYWLVDYDAASNYGNWNYVAGIGNDGRGFRFFHVTKQGETYDTEGTFVKHYVPELAQMPASWVHKPWLAPEVVCKSSNFASGKSYPLPIVPLEESAKAAEVAYKHGLIAGGHKKATSRIRKFIKF